MKTKWDNWLRAAAEIHVFWTITIAFVVRNDLSHEVLGNDAWGGILVISLIVCVPASYIVCLIGKWREINGDLREAQQKDEAMDQSVNSTENERLVTKARVAYCAYKHGLSTAADRQLLKSYCMELKKPARERSTRCDPPHTHTSPSPPPPASFSEKADATGRSSISCKRIPPLMRRLQLRRPLGLGSSSHLRHAGVTWPRLVGSRGQCLQSWGVH